MDKNPPKKKTKLTLGHKTLIMAAIAIIAIALKCFKVVPEGVFLAIMSIDGIGGILFMILTSGV